MSFCVIATPYVIDGDPDSNGMAFVTFRVGGEGGRYDIDIFIKTPLPDEGEAAYGDEGELTIRDRKFTIPKGEAPMVAAVKAVLDQHTNMAQESCFSTSESVPATPENIVRAIQWCQANPKFMQDEQGI